MIKKILGILGVVIVLILFYFLAWPVPVDPVAWEAPPNPGYNGVFAANQKLQGVETLSIGKNSGPEDIALDSEGRIYAATHAGNIVRLKADGSQPENWVNTKGRPLGIDFDNQGNLIVADAYRGLLSIDPGGTVIVLTNEVNGTPILYADDVDVADDGKIYFSDASTKFGAQMGGGTYESSLLDIMEHGGHGRLLVYDPANRSTKMLLSGLNFANGVTLSHDQSFVLVNETGSYRVTRYWLTGPKKGQSDRFIEALPSFPDNISRGLNGRYWVALVSPRSTDLDNMSGNPFARKIVQRMPAFMRPKAIPYGHVIALDENGKVVQNLQDPDAGYPIITSVTEREDYLYLGSLVTPVMGRLAKAKIGL